jgi:signal transduction histidine kinase
VAPATVIFFPTLLLAAYMNQPVYQFVQRLVYGEPLAADEYLAELNVTLSKKPEMGALRTVVTSLAELLTAEQAVLVLRDRHGRFLPVAQVGCDWTAEISPRYAQNITEPVVRTMAEDAAAVSDERRALFDLWPWAEALLPIVEQDEVMGLLVVSRPGQDGYFDAQQVLFLIRAAGALGIACQNLYLFESTRRLSRDLLAAQKDERQRLASQIHDDPLQRITYVTTILDQIVANPAAFAPAQIGEHGANGARHLRITAAALRDICTGLRSPLWDQGLTLAVEEIIDAFEFEHDLHIEAEVALGDQEAIFKEQLPAVCHILTEALNNIVKHAQARTAFVTLRGDASGLSLQVADEGKGGGLPDMTISDLIRQQHLGIVGMYEWARLAGGKLTFQANQPTGMRVHLDCPLG